MPIISISGQMGSGKDTVGKIIQILTCFPKMKHEKIIKDVLSNREYNNIKWEIVKFADSLKDCVCTILGCTRNQLEDIDFKNTPLPKEYNRWRVTYRDKIDNIITNYHLDPLLAEEELSLFSYIPEEESMEEIEMTPREFMQLFGTEVGRSIHQNIWVNALFSKYKPKEISYSLKMRKGNIEHFGLAPNWIITDTRFPNELKAVEERNGITIRVNRDLSCEVCKLTKYERKGNNCHEITCPNGRSNHASETALDDAEFDYVINNNGSLSNLIGKVQAILEIEGIIKKE